MVAADLFAIMQAGVKTEASSLFFIALIMVGVIFLEIDYERNMFAAEEL